MRGNTDSARIFVVVAAYNEASHIRAVIDRLLKIYPNVIVVDDGSSDATSSRLVGSGVLIVRHPVNRGQGAALQTGIEFALRCGADIVVTFDADGQHDADDIAALVAPILDGECDVTLGSRFLGRAHGIPAGRVFLLKISVLFTRALSGLRITDSHNGLRAFSRRAASTIHLTLDRMAHASEMLDQIAEKRWRYCEIPVNIYYSPYSLNKGQSSLNAVRIGLEVLLKRVSK